MDISVVKQLFVKQKDKTANKPTISTTSAKNVKAEVFSSVKTQVIGDDFKPANTNITQQKSDDTKNSSATTNPFVDDNLLNSRNLLYIKERGDKQFSDEEILKLAYLPDKQFEKVKSRNLLFDKERSKQFNGDEIIELSKLSDEEFNKLKESGLYNIKERKDKQFSGQTLVELAKSDDKTLKRAKKLAFIKERNLDNQLSEKAVSFLAKMSDTDYENMEKRGLLYIKERGDKQLGGSIGAISHLSDEEFQTVQKRGLLADTDVAGFAIAEYSKLSDKEFNFVKNFQNLDKNARITIEEVANMSKMAANQPEKWEKIKNSGLLEMVKEGKLNVDVLHSLGENSDLSKEMQDDLALLKSGKTSIVNEFMDGTSPNDAFSKTKTGDVVSIGNKMFINDGKKLIPWQMSKEKCDELFPPVKRFSNIQGALGDCYLVSAMDSCMKNPQTRTEMYQLFTQKGDDIYVQIKGSKNEPVKFTKGEVYLGDENKHLTGCKGMQMLEQAFAIDKLSEPDVKEPHSLTNKTVHSSVMKSIESGHSSEAISKLLGYKDLSNYENTIPCGNKTTKLVAKEDLPKSDTSTDTTALEAYLTKYANNGKNILQFATIVPENTDAESTLNKKYNILSQHAYGVSGYNEQTKMVSITNPHNSSVEIQVPLNELNNYISHFYLTKIE